MLRGSGKRVKSCSESQVRFVNISPIANRTQEERLSRSALCCCAVRQTTQQNKQIFRKYNKVKIVIIMSSGFISEAVLEEKRQKRQEEWEKVRKPSDPEQAPEEPQGDPR